MKALLNDPRTMTAEADMCQFGMVSRDKDGPGFARKPTTFLTTSVEIQKALSRKCTPGQHRHVPLMEGRAAALVYPRQLREPPRGRRGQIAATS